MSITKISTAHMSREEWLLRRRRTIGGSDAAGVMGMSPWATPYTVWAEKTGLLQEKPDTEAMRQGRDLEDYVARRFAEASGKTVRRENFMLYHDGYPFAHADIDRWVVGEKSGLECKTTSALNVRSFRGGDFPEAYYAQCIHYLAVTGARRWYLSVLILNQGLHIYCVTKLPEDPKPDWCESVIYIGQTQIDALMTRERELWALVQSGVPPAFDGADATTEALARTYPDGRDAERRLCGQSVLLRRYENLRARRRALETEQQRIAQTVMQDLGACERGRCGSFSVLWKSQTRSVFDAARFAGEHPNIDLTPYYKTTASRVFRIEKERSKSIAAAARQTKKAACSAVPDTQAEHPAALQMNTPAKSRGQEHGRDT